MHAQDILDRANDLLDTYELTTDAYARDKDGNHLDSFLDGRAMAMCAMGVLGRAAYDCGFHAHGPEKVAALAKFREVAGIPEGVSVTQWNDDMASESDVREAFRRASSATTEALVTI